HPAFDMVGSITEPVSFEQWPEERREFIGGTVADGMHLLGQRTGELHIALASRKDIKDFAPEEFSLHYQRSIYSGLQTLVRAAFQSTQKNLSNFPEEIRHELEQLLGQRSALLTKLKRIYNKKLNVVRIR